MTHCPLNKRQIIEIENNQLEDGFSSDSQVLLEQQPEDLNHVDQIEDQIHEQVKMKLDKPQEVSTKNYSLQPDIETGWALKKQLPKPIPLLFQNQFIDTLVSNALKQQSFKCRLIYLGPRFDTTLLAWHNKQFIFPYHHLNVPHFPKYSRRQFCGQKRGLPLDTVLFDSHFQSGNLDAVFKINATHYQLFLRVDSNTRGHIQWFNFTLKNMKKQNSYKLSICNLTKRSTLFTRGCKPYFYSSKKHEKEGIGWHQDGQKVSYEQKTSVTAKSHDMESNHFMLTFSYQPEYDDDEIQISYSIPYSFSRLNSFIQNLVQREKKQYLKVLKLCTSLGGLEVPLMIIDDSKTKNQCLRKKCIIVSGRAHPGESNGSFMMQGFIQFLCGNTKIAEQLRQNVIFKIIPMLNPDGVAIGNHRTGLSGKDFNRNFSNPNKQTSPEVFHLKKLVTDTKTQFGDDLLMFLDFHGHSVKKNVFMYGPQFPISNPYYYEARVFPKILSEITKLFRYYSCVFRISQVKESTARVVMMKKMQIPLSYTIEASNGSFYNYDQHKDEPFNEYKWAEMGVKIVESLCKYCEGILQKEKIRLSKLKNQKHHSVQSKHHRRIHYKHPQSHQIHHRKREEEHPERVKKHEQFVSFEETVRNQNQMRQIRELERKRKENIQSDDQISESSSDGEGELEDLAEQKAALLLYLLEDKANAHTLNYNPKQVQLFLVGNQEDDKRRQPIWMRQFKEVKQRQRFASYSNNQRQPFRKSEQKSSFTQRSVENYGLKKDKTKTPRVISFGTGMINFESNNFQRSELEADKLYESILKKKNSTLYQKTGFLPSKRRQICDKNTRKIQIISALTTSRDEDISKLNSTFVDSIDKRQMITRYKEREMINSLASRKGQMQEPCRQTRSTNFVISTHRK